MRKLILAFFLAVVVAQVVAEPHLGRRRRTEHRLARVERRVARIVRKNPLRARRVKVREATLRAEIAASTVAPSAPVPTAAPSSDTASDDPTSNTAYYIYSDPAPETG